MRTVPTDEREKYDPTGFRDAVLLGLDKAGNDLEAISKFLDAAGSKLDYRRYGEALFDIMIAGGLLVPGGSIAQDGDKPVKTNACVFEQLEDMESMRNFEQVIIPLVLSIDDSYWYSHIRIKQYMCLPSRSSSSLCDVTSTWRKCLKKR